MQFVVFLKQQELLVKYIRGKFSAIAFYSKAKGFVEFTSDFHLRKMLEE